MTPTSRRAKHAAEHRHAVARLLKVYRATAVSERAIGRSWYADAQATAARLARPDAGIGTDRAAAIIAVLSPQVRWRENVAGAARLIERYSDPALVSADANRFTSDLPGYPANHAKALALAQGAEFGTGQGDALGAEAPKVRNFLANIMGDADAVTLDVWAMRVATGKDGPPPRGARYAQGAAWYRAAAEAVGETARDFQAIVWTAARGALEHERDVAARTKGTE